MIERLGRKATYKWSHLYLFMHQHVQRESTQFRGKDYVVRRINRRLQPSVILLRHLLSRGGTSLEFAPIAERDGELLSILKRMENGSRDC